MYPITRSTIRVDSLGTKIGRANVERLHTDCTVCCNLPYTRTRPFTDSFGDIHAHFIHNSLPSVRNVSLALHLHRLAGRIFGFAERIVGSIFLSPRVREQEFVLKRL